MQLRPTGKGIYTIEGLASEAGVTVDQIRKWTKKKVLSPALRAGASPFVWTETHLKEAITVREILDSNMTLDDIRDRLHPPQDDDDADFGDMAEWFTDAF